MGRPAEALASYERARAIFARLARENPSVIRIQSDLASTLVNIGSLQRETGRPAEALESCEQARAIRDRLVRGNPSVTDFQRNLAASLINIGMVQRAIGRSAAALESYEQACAIQERLARDHPESPDLASDMGGTLNNMATINLDGRQFYEARAKLARAIDWQRKALAANPNHPMYRQFMATHLGNLVRATEGLGRADLADDARRRLAELAASDPAKAVLDARLADVLNGKETARDNAERIQLADRAYQKALHASSARLYAEALANDPKLAEDRQPQHAYNAACAAALAASGQGKDDPPPDEAARAKLRQQAREWLEAELAFWAKIADAGAAQTKAIVPPTLKHWKADADLAGVRDEKELAKLPDEERGAFKQLWNDVDQLLTKAAASAPDRSRRQLPRRCTDRLPSRIKAAQAEIAVGARCAVRNRLSLVTGLGVKSGYPHSATRVAYCDRRNVHVRHASRNAAYDLKRTLAAVRRRMSRISRR